MAWIVLVIAGLLEIVWAVALKHAEGFSRFRPAVLVIGKRLGQLRAARRSVA